MRRTNTPTPSFIPDQFDLTIDSLSYNGGRGVGRFDGLVVFVANTAPGDRVRVSVQERKHNFIVAELREILEPSSHRREPPCPVAGRCGGCSWQHVSYSQQVLEKQKIIESSLKLLLRKDPQIEVRSFLSAENEWHYRNRIQIQIEGQRKGFFAKGSRDLVEVSECLIAEPIINESLKNLAVDDFKNQRRVELALNESGRVLPRAGDRDPEEALFSQVNRAQNEVLIKTLVELATAPVDWIVDLYCGSGNLTVPLAKRFSNLQKVKKIIGVELSKSSIHRAQKLWPEIDWIAKDVEVYLKSLQAIPGKGLIVTDPPRVGMTKQALQQLMRIKPQQIIYVSCNPSTFARDATTLIDQGYRLSSVQGLDMFPQTAHIELISSFISH